MKLKAKEEDTSIVLRQALTNDGQNGECTTAVDDRGTDELQNTHACSDTSIVTAEMLERQRKLWWWKFWVSLVVKTSFILLKFCLVMLAIALFPDDETDKDEGRQA